MKCYIPILCIMIVVLYGANFVICSGGLVHIDTGVDESDNDVKETQTKENSESIEEAFIPTREWQVVKKGQSIPPGLHVRMNLQTGLHEAKLMDGDEVGDKKPKSVLEETADRLALSMEEVRNNLKNIKSDLDMEQDSESSKKRLKKFRSIDELKEKFKKMNVNMKSDFEIVSELLTKYNSTDLNDEDRETILIDLEYYLHQIDNAKYFADAGGLALLIKDLNHTKSIIRGNAALSIGSAVQSNPYVQVKAIEHGILQVLIRSLPNEVDDQVRNRLLFAISSLVRQFPYAQLKFVQLGGLSAIVELFHKGGTEKLRIKAITLINDLILEHKHTELASNENKIQEEKFKQYKKVSLMESLLHHNWCELLPNMLELHDHDSREKVLHAMDTLISACKEKFLPTIPNLNKLKSEYVNELQNETSDKDFHSYFEALIASIDSMISKLSVKDEL